MQDQIDTLKVSVERTARDSEVANSRKRVVDHRGNNHDKLGVSSSRSNTFSNTDNFHPYCLVVPILLLAVVVVLCILTRWRRSDDARTIPDSSCFEVVEDAADLGPMMKAAYAGAMPVPQDEGQLSELLKSGGIDTSNWGESLSKLQSELTSGGCYLARGLDTSQPKMLVRVVRIIFVRIAGSFPLSGFHTLVTFNSHDGCTDKHKNIARRIHGGDDFDEEWPELLLHDLALPVEWQQKHLQVVHTRTAILDSDQERGISFPSLHSHYSSEEVWLRIADIDAEDVVEKLPRGRGVFKIDGADGLVRRYEWTNPADFERDIFQRSLGSSRG